MKTKAEFSRRYMTKKDFKKYMMRGLGRCNNVLQGSDNIEKYKDVVLWGCLHDLSFDTQCEGTRADYVYRLTKYFDDEEYFLSPTIKAFEKISFDSNWLFYHYADLLQRFAEDGSERAKDSLHKKYDFLLSKLLRKRKFIQGTFDREREFYEATCLTLISLEGIDAVVKIAKDMGYLYIKNSHYREAGFYWYYSAIDRRFGEKRIEALLKRKSKECENTRSFYENYKKSKEEYKSIKPMPTHTPIAEDIKNEVEFQGSLSPASRVHFSRYAEDEERLKLAEMVIAEPNSDLKAELLLPFLACRKGFPLSHQIIIEYSKSSNETLQNIALCVLTNCKSKNVLEYAFELLEKEKHVSQALEMMLCNYVPEIKDILLARLYELKIDYKEESHWHSIILKIFRVQEEGVKLPKEFFFYIYEASLCSCCREYAINALAKRRALTKDILEECRFDSNDEISKYANRYFKKSSKH